MRFAEYLFPHDTAFSQTLKQVGVDDVVSKLNRHVGVYGMFDDTGDRPWDYVPLARVKETCEAFGLRLSGIEDWPPMDRARLGRPGRDEEIEAFCTLIRNMGKLGIPMLCYNWMAVMSATRTRMAVRARGGALVTGFRVADVADAPLTHAGVVEAGELWDAFEYFLKRVVPVAEEAGVRLALHPDDPPIPSLRGVARIMIDVDAFDRAMEVVDSEANAICLCQGNFGLMTDDLPGVIRHFGRDGRIAYGHFRDVRGEATDFVETFHDEGPRDAPAAMRAWHEIGFDGLIRSDHVPTLAGDEGHEPPNLARLHALGYLQGLRDATAPGSDPQ